MSFVADKPWVCFNCRTRASEDQETCKKCGDRLKAKSALRPPVLPARSSSIDGGPKSYAAPAGPFESPIMRAIETRYAGCHFRSRLEARWAVFLDALKIEWQYEPQGFELPSGRYLPDFYLPYGTAPADWVATFMPHMHAPAWLEVKGRTMNVAETQLARELVRESGVHLYALERDIPRTRHCTYLNVPALMMPHLPANGETNGIWNPIDFVIDWDLQVALDAARSARFEHGQGGVG